MCVGVCVCVCGCGCVCFSHSWFICRFLSFLLVVSVSRRFPGPRRPCCAFVSCVVSLVSPGSVGQTSEQHSGAFILGLHGPLQ